MNRFRIASLAAVLGLAGLAPAQLLTIDYGVRQSMSGGNQNQSNSNALDLTNGLVVSACYQNTDSIAGGTLYFFNAADGTPATPAFVSYSPDPAEPVASGTLSPFAITSLDGNYYVYHEVGISPGGIEVLDSTTDTEATVVSPWQTIQFSRNMDIIGTGAETFIALVGSGDANTSRVSLTKADDATLANFSLLGDIAATGVDAGTGRAGVGMAGAPTSAGVGPDWIAAADTIGISGGRMMLLQRTGALADANLGYVEFARLDPAVPTSDVAIDPNGASGLPVVFALHVPADGLTNSADIGVYQAVDSPSNALVTLGVFSIPLNDGGSLNLGTSAMTNRGSLDIDTANNQIYAMYRPGSPSTDVVIVRLTYDITPPASAENWQSFE